MFVVTVVLSLGLATVLTMSTIRKFTGAPESLQLRDRLALPPGLWFTVGVLEAAAVAGLLVGLAVAPMAIAAATGTVLLMGGAVIAHLRHGLRGAALMAPAAVLLADAGTALLHVTA